MAKKRTKASEEKARSAPEPIEPPAMSDDLSDFIAEYEELQQIDEHALDDGNRDQVTSYLAVARRAALEQSRRDASKLYLRTVESRLDAEIREEAKRLGEKITEKDVESRKIAHPEYQQAHIEHLAVERGTRDIEALERAYLQRSYVLRHLGELWIAGYYGESAASGAETSSKNLRAGRVKESIRRNRNTD